MVSSIPSGFPDGYADRLGTLTSLKDVKKDVSEMRKDSECGMGFTDWTGFQPGDHVQCYEEFYENRHL